MKNIYHTNRSELNSFVVNIEFLLISVVQGAALATLAATASQIFGDFQLEFFLYVFSALLFILTFWSQSIIHTLSFIDWPLDITHNFFYFILAFVEVIAFTELEDPLKYFLFVVLFFLIAGILYIIDLRLVRKHKDKYDSSKEARALYKHILRRQEYELHVLVPLGLLYNIFCVLLIYFYPSTFLDLHYHILLISIQLAFGLVVMSDTIKSFKERSLLITACIKED